MGGLDKLTIVYKHILVVMNDITYLITNSLSILNVSVLDQSASTDNSYYWLFGLLAVFALIGAYFIFKFFKQRVEIQRNVLEKKVALRTSEILEQKEVLQKQSEHLQKANEEIKMKNMAIEEAFEHLSNSYAKLSDLNREKDGMMNIVVHDLRTPLNNIEGLIQLITLDDNLNEEQKEYVATIRMVVQRGNEMIRDLLDINQARKSKADLKITQFSMSEFVQNWKVSFEKQLSQKKQHLHVTGNLQDILLQTDAGILSRILDNLMSNAMKFSKKDKNIFLEVMQQNEHVNITIRDEGPGISESDQLKMFKPFTRLSARPTDGEHSNGLGLSIIKSLSQQLGGKVSVTSKLGVGTAFAILIPVNVSSIAVK